jgi:hypothetical protein
LVVTNVAQGLQVLQQSTHHTGHGSHGFKNHGPVAIAARKELIGENTHEFHDAQRKPITPILWHMVNNGRYLGIG